MPRQNRLYTKEVQSLEDLLKYCGKAASLWLEVESFLLANYDLRKIVHNSLSEGWGVNYKHDKTQICDIHAEKDAFTAIFHLRYDRFDLVKENLTERTLTIWEKRYPCGSGGWIRYLVTEQAQLTDLYSLLKTKVKPRKIGINMNS